MERHHAERVTVRVSGVLPAVSPSGVEVWAIPGLPAQKAFGSVQAWHCVPIYHWLASWYV